MREHTKKIIGNSEFVYRIKKQINLVSKTDIAVLILGETGTGKELVARGIHAQSPRNKYPFIPVNSAAIPETLIESTLFGHKRGSFTGAFEDQIGKFQLADKGTLFLDEIGDLSLKIQPKILRALEKKKIEPIGKPSTSIDIRIITATNNNLIDKIEKKEFRKDLYYRINIFPIYLAPLRERKEDIPLLVDHFLQKYYKEMHTIEDKALEKLIDYNWPGNIRELKNIILRSIIYANGNKISAEHIKLDNEMVDPNKYYCEKNKKEKIMNRENDEKKEIEKLLLKHKYNKTNVADEMEISRNTLYKRMDRLEIPY